MQSITLLPIPEVDCLPVHLKEETGIAALVLVAHAVDPTTVPVAIHDILSRLDGAVGSTHD